MGILGSRVGAWLVGSAACLLTVSYVVADTIPVHDATTGTMAGQAGTDGGASTYQVPIVVPPGRAGMQPSLSLTYNSRSGDGIAGMGWTLSGLSSIHRCPQTPEQDGTTVGVSYSSTDRLCLDGQRLVPFSGTYGQNGAEYRTEVDSHARITQTGGDLTGAGTCFRVEHKDGRILHYGAVTGADSNGRANGCTGGTSRVQPTGAAATLAWQVEKIEDRIGNNQAFTYTNVGNGEVLLQTVRYTGFTPTSVVGDRTVTFAYEPRLSASAVTDIASSYLAGGLTMQTQALASITTAIAGSTVRTYTPSYAAASYSGRLLMTDLQECATNPSGTACHPRTHFQLNDGPLDYPLTSLNGILPAGAFVRNPSITASPNQIAVISDLDGDGARETAAAVTMTDAVHLFVLQLTGDRQAHTAIDLTGTPFSFSPQAYADIDSDGRGKLIQLPQSGSADQHVSFDVWKLGRGVPATTVGTPAQNFAALFQNVPSNIPYTFGQAAPHAQYQTLYLADIDGDGKPDVLLVAPAASGCGAPDAIGIQDGVFFYRNTTIGALSATNPATFTLPSGPLFCLPRTLNTQGSITTYHEPAIDHIADFDGNGLPDFYLVNVGDDPQTGSFAGIELTHPAGPPTKIQPLTCDGTAGSTTDECYWQNGYVAHWMDVNGDGLEDFVIARPNQGLWEIRLNQGSGVLGPEINTLSSDGLKTDVAPGGNPSGYAFRYATKLSTMDVDGDGKADLLIPSVAKSFAVKMCTIKLVSLLPNGEGCPTADGAAQVAHPPNPDATGQCAAWACPEDVGADTVTMPANSFRQGYDYQWSNLQSGNQALPAFGSYSSDTRHGGQGGDNSVYHLAMLKFFQTDATHITTKIVETPMESNLNGFTHGSEDLFGDGLNDLTATVGCVNMQQEVINGGSTRYYNVCSVVADGIHGPNTALPDGSPPCTPQPDGTCYFDTHPILYANINQGVAGYGGSPGIPLAPSQHVAPATITMRSPGTPLVSRPFLPGLLDGATNGVLDFASWDYFPLSIPVSNANVPLYTVPPTNGYVDSRHYYFQSSMPVVSGMAQDSGSGDGYGFRSAFYGYSEAIYNHLGRGFQGFRTITSNSVAHTADVARQLRTTTTYNQNFPLTGTVFKVDTTAPDTNNLLIKRETDTWICGLTNRTACPQGASLPVPTGNTVYAPVLDEHLIERFDVGTGAATSHTDTVNAATVTATASGWDTNGNLTQQLITNADDGAGGSFISSHTVSATNIYAAAANWWLDKLNQRTATTTVTYASTHMLPPGASAPAHTATTTFQWNTDRTPNVQTTQPGVTNQELTTTYGYPSPSYGLPTSVSVSGSAVSPSPRTTQFSYTKDGTTGATDGYFVLTTTNAANHLTKTQRSTRDGQVTTAIDPNSLKAVNTYDAFGRLTSTDFLDAAGGTLLPSAYDAYTSCSGLAVSTCPGGYGEDGNQAYAAWRVTHVQAGAPTRAEWFDVLGRTIKQVKRGFSGTFIESTTNYDEWNAVAEQSTPFFLGGTPYLTGFNYDRLNRPTLKNAPGSELDPTHGNVVTSYTYNGATTSIKVRGANVSTVCSSSTNLCMDMSRSYDVLGRLEQTVQNNGNIANYAVTKYWYDGTGHPVAVQDAESNVIRASYNDVGQRTDLYDPDAGHVSYTYDALGEVLRQTDARGVYTDHVYDALGRLVQRTANNPSPGDPSLAILQDTWHYDPIGTAGGQGLLGSAQRRKGASSLSPIWTETYAYEAATKRLQTQTSTLAGQANWMTSYTYDTNGREQTVSYPSGLVVKTGYTPYGEVNQLSNNGTSAVYWTGTAQDAWSNITGESVTGLTGAHTSYASTGQVKQKKWLSGVTAVDQLDYTYDSFGNVHNQATTLAAVTASEAYLYDGLQRLTQTTRSGVPGSPQVAYGYTASGNISYKTDLSTPASGAYTYAGNGCGPHAVTAVILPICNSSPSPGMNGATPASSSLCGYTLSYMCDANGNVTGGNTLTGGLYDFNNEPWAISRTSIGAAQFAYDVNGHRFEEQATSHSTWFGPHGFERTVSGGQSTDRHELGPVTVDRVGALDSVHANLRDRLGSTVALSNGGATLSDTRAYDAFGTVRNGNFTDRANGTLNLLPQTLRGFTGHEHVDDVQLIHMNGRIYDYTLGRFLSVDPIIQNPANTQSLNPYSYIGNNPLSGKDPTGYYAVDTRSICFHSPGSCGQISGTDATSALKSMSASMGASGSREQPHDSMTPQGSTSTPTTHQSGDIGQPNKIAGKQLAQAEPPAEEGRDAESSARAEESRARGVSPALRPAVEGNAAARLEEAVQAMQKIDPNYKPRDTNSSLGNNNPIDQLEQVQSELSARQAQFMSEVLLGGPRPPKNWLPPTNPPQLPPTNLPEGHTIRQVGPTPIYRNGYWRQYDQNRNPINPATGKQPGSVTKAEANAQTHVELPPREEP